MSATVFSGLLGLAVVCAETHGAKSKTMKLCRKISRQVMGFIYAPAVILFRRNKRRPSQRKLLISEMDRRCSGGVFAGHLAQDDTGRERGYSKSRQLRPTPNSTCSGTFSSWAFSICCVTNSFIVSSSF